MREAQANPFAVVLRRKKLPVSLCTEKEGERLRGTKHQLFEPMSTPTGERPAKARREQLLAHEPFADTFGGAVPRGNRPLTLRTHINGFRRTSTPAEEMRSKASRTASTGRRRPGYS